LAEQGVGSSDISIERFALVVVFHPIHVHAQNRLTLGTSGGGELVIGNKRSHCPSTAFPKNFFHLEY